jgi:hypothetical protein
MIGAWVDLDTTATQADAPTAAPASPDAPVTPPPESGGIDQLAFLVGGTWVSAAGSQTIAEETCVWGAGNHSIRTTVVLRSGGKVTGQGHGRFNYSSPTDQLMSHSDIESEGTDQRMYARQVPFAGPVQGAVNQWHFEAVFLTDAGVQHRRMILNQLGPDAMRIDQSLLQGGKVLSLPSVTYGRKV